MDITLPSGAVFDFGDTPEEQVAEELTNLRTSNPELFQESIATEPQSEGPPNPVTTPYSELKAYYDKNPSGSAESQEPDFTPTIDGDITDIPTRYAFGKEDTPEEKERFLTETYGPGSFGKDRSGRYYLELDNISPEIKAEKNLQDSGTMWFNKPGGGFFGLFDMGDIAGFGGEYRGELIGGTVAALALPASGIIATSIAIGVGAGLGKGADELQELFEGTQRQSKDEILGAMANAFAFNSLGNFIVGGAAKLLGRLFKGPGNPDAQVISDLIDTGMSPGKAKTAAVQIQRTQTRDLIKRGGSPTISDATGKAVLGRMQAIHEGIFPNKKAARANRKLVENLIAKYKNGELSDGAFGAALDQNAKEVTKLISNAMKDPDEAVRLANQHLQDVIKVEMDLLKKVYTTGDETAASFQNEMVRMVRLWQHDTSKLYETSDSLFGNVKLFKSDNLGRIAQEQIDAPLGQGLANNPVYQYILSKSKAGESLSISELQTLRSTIQNTRSGSLVGDVSDYQLKKLSDELDNMFNAGELRTQEVLQKARDGILTFEDLGIKNMQAGARVSQDKMKEVIKDFTKGFDIYADAQKNYKEGAEIFKTGAMNMLNQNVKEGYFADLSSIVEAIVQPNKPQLLKNYLKGVTPKESTRKVLNEVEGTQWSLMSDAARKGDLIELNRLIGANGLEKAGAFKPPKVLDSLAEDNPYRQRVLSDLAETFTLHADDAAARASGVAHKDVSRQMLANSWLKTAVAGSEDISLGQTVFDTVKFRDAFTRLGREVQDELFGAVEAKRLNAVISDFALVAPDKVKRGLRFETAVPDSINNSNMRNIVSNLQSDVAEAEAQSASALFQAVKSGKIDNAEDLIQAAVKDQKLLDDLIAKVPDYALDQPFGLKDAAMSRIMREAFPDGITEDAVISGAWQNGMAGALANLNQRGALNKILGRDAVEDLVKLTKLPIGDQALRGKGGLASSAYAAGIGMRILAEPVSGLLSVAGVYASGRILRNPMFLKLMTRPNIRASELKAGIRALTDDIMAKAKADGVNITRKQARDSAKQQFGNLSVLRRRFTELATTEARLIVSTKASESTGPEQRQAIGQAITGAANAARPVVQDIRQQLPDAAAAAQQMNPLRQIEENKLLGIGANQ
tara:strand:- start:15 stop:3428 length:3414 start_codon:yes stop_codon:yes gene_type:complete